MVEVVDTTDLKSVGPNGPCGFEPHSGYLLLAVRDNGIDQHVKPSKDLVVLFSRRQVHNDFCEGHDSEHQLSSIVENKI